MTVVINEDLEIEIIQQLAGGLWEVRDIKTGVFYEVTEDQLSECSPA